MTSLSVRVFIDKDGSYENYADNDSAGEEYRFRIGQGGVLIVQRDAGEEFEPAHIVYGPTGWHKAEGDSVTATVD